VICEIYQFHIRFLHGYVSSLNGHLSLVRYSVPCIGCFCVLLGRTFVFSLRTKKPWKNLLKTPSFFSPDLNCCPLRRSAVGRGMGWVWGYKFCPHGSPGLWVYYSVAKLLSKFTVSMGMRWVWMRWVKAQNNWFIEVKMPFWTPHFGWTPRSKYTW